jgi:PAS domain S-box-containing protein
VSRTSDASGLGSQAGRQQLARFAERYDIVKLLKDGSGVTTYLAVDSATAYQVVLKTCAVSALPAGARARFLNETRVLRELSGLGLCGLHDAGQTGTHLYLAQQYVAGETLEAVLRSGPLSIAGALSVGVALASALDLAHSAGVTHRDVKPANVIVDEAGADGRLESVTLIDFGLARSPWLDESIREELVGTARYLSPEAAGLLPREADERSDLYALGVVLFESLTGRPPFQGATVGEVLRHHLSTRVPELTGAREPIPTALTAVVQRLLRKDPSERYQSAAAVAADLVQILAARRSGDPDPAVVIGRHDHRVTLTDPAFVGRETELASLTSIVTGLDAGRGGIVLVEAESGGGKSRLLAEVAARAAEAGVAVLSGQGVALGGQRPFALLHGVVDDLLAELDADATRRDELARELEDVAPSIVLALPRLAALLGTPASVDAGPEQFGELRSLGGIRRLFDALADATRPTLIILDDCQWSDALTVRLLTELFADPAHAPRHLGVITAFRSEEVPNDHPLRRVRAVQRIHLGPLTRRSIALLAESMAGQLPPDAIATVARLADGNPFMAAAVLRGLVEAEAIVPGPAGWVLDSSRLSEIQAARRSAAFLVRRLELLGADALELLSVGAVLGNQFSIRTATRVAGELVDADAILDDARRRRLLWLDESGSACTFFHDKIRESLLARLDADVRRDLHGRAADALIEESVGDPGELVFDLAYHLHQAGRRADALPYALAAAELARRRYTLDVAASHYRLANELVGADDARTHRRIAEGLGDVLMLDGSYSEARTQLDAARALATDAADAAALDGKLGALAFKQGDIATAKGRLEGALQLLGRHVPRRFLLVPCLLWELLVQAVHTVLPRLTTGRSRAAGADDKFLAMLLYSRLAYLYWFHSGKVACAWAHLRGMNLAERYGPSPELGQAWSEHAPVMTMLPWYRRGIRYAQRSLEVRRALGDVWGQGQSLNFTGVVRYAASEFEAAESALHEAMRLLRRTGDQWEVNTASWNVALCRLRTGQLRQAVDTCQETFDAARAIGDQTAAGITLSIWARAVDGRIPHALVREQLEHGVGDAQTTAELLLAEALVHRREGDLPAALQSIEHGVKTIGDAGLRQEYIAPLFAWHATLLRELAESTPSYAPRLGKARTRAAARAARRALRWARAYRNNEPHARRELGLVAAAQGHERLALMQLSRSAAAAQRIGARFEEALTKLALAEVRAARTDAPSRATERAQALDAVRAFDPVLARAPGAPQAGAALSVFDRFATLLKVGHAIASATTEAALEAAVRDSAIRLLRAERCHVVATAAIYDQTITTRSGEDLGGVSRTLLMEAVAQSAPVVALNDSFGAMDSLVLSGIRSALAVPISVRGTVRSCLYVTHRQVGELFGDEEMQLASFIATLAGAAYEHLLGSETRFRALVQSSTDVITLVDPDGMVRYQSPSVQAVFGLPANGLVGMSISHWVHPDDVAEFVEALRDAASSLGIGNGLIECRMRDADGSYRFVESTISNLLDEPTVAALVVNTRDITERMLAVDRLLLAEERERIARDLHDVVIQRLFAVGMNLDLLAGGLSPEAAAKVSDACDELHHTIRDIRGAIFTMRSDKPELPLTDRLHAVVMRAATTLGFEPDVDVDERIDDAVPGSLHWHMIATVNEALSNVARHASASRASLRIALDERDVVVTVSDDGRGLPPEPKESGLLNLRRRAQMSGGAMTIEAGANGRGLVLSWRVPILASED